MKRDIDYYFSFLKNLDNPIYYAIIFIILFYALLLVIYKYIFLPLKKKHFLEKKGLAEENLKILEIFTEYDPNPIIRIDAEGNILNSNKSATRLFGISGDIQKNIKGILPEINFDLKDEISKSAILQIDVTYRERHFAVNFYGLKSLNLAQIYFLDITERTNRETKTKESEKKFRSLSFYLQDYLEEEKQRIGLELHDVIGQNLFLLKLEIEEAAKNCDNFKDRSTRLSDSLNSTIQELRNIMFDLKPKNLDDFGLDFAIKQLSEHISKSSKIDGSVEIIGKPKRFNNDSELYLFRIIQESLSNVIKHSKATEYNIQLLYSDENLQVFISDNGIGFDVDNSQNDKNYGLLNISERINALNGIMKIESSEEGTLLLFEIPI